MKSIIYYFLFKYKEGNSKYFILIIRIFQYAEIVITFLIFFLFLLFFLQVNKYNFLLLLHHTDKQSRRRIFHVTRFFLVEVIGIFSFLQCGEYYGGFSSANVSSSLFGIRNNAPESGCGKTSLFATLAV